MTSLTGWWRMSAWSKTLCMTPTSLTLPTCSRPRITGICEISYWRNRSSAVFTVSSCCTVISGGSGVLLRSTSPTVARRLASARKPLAIIQSSLKIFDM